MLLHIAETFRELKESFSSIESCSFDRHSLLEVFDPSHQCFLVTREMIVSDVEALLRNQRFNLAQTMILFYFS